MLIFRSLKWNVKLRKMSIFDTSFFLLLILGSKAAKAARDIYAMYGESAIAERTARDWYAKFKNGNFNLKDAPRSGRPVEFDKERLNFCTKIQTTRELAEKMECSHTAIEKHLHSMGKVQKCGAWFRML